jgi:hypothetical protein
VRKSELDAREALTSPALLSQRERREKDRSGKVSSLFPSLPLGERGQGSEGFAGNPAQIADDPR